MEGTTSPGQFTFILDAVILANCTVQFDMIKRSGDTEEVLKTFQDSYTPLSDGNKQAQGFEYDAPDLPAFTFAKGDVFVFRFTKLMDCPILDSYIPNGDGASTGGQVPHIVFPP